MAKAKPRKILLYKERSGKEPFTEWHKSLRDTQAKGRILRRLRMLEQGHRGDYKALGAGLFELRFFFGSGYRVYYGEDGVDIIIILCGGDKASQRRDIDKAQSYWTDYKLRRDAR